MFGLFKPTMARPADPISPKVARLLREASWMFLAALGGYLALILFTFHPDDPGWSHTANNDLVRNTGGPLGAWLSDILLSAFGVSAWWWAALAFVVVLHSYRRLDFAGLIDRHSAAVTSLGFVLLLLASAGLEALRFHSVGAELPGAPGGMLGALISRGVAAGFGFTGATLLMLVVFAIGFSLFTGLSWIRLAEKTGHALELFFLTTRQHYQAWRDRRAGEEAQIEREGSVGELTRMFEQHEPVLIAPPAPQAVKSARVAQEKQVPLFADLPDSELPPLSLLDAPAAPVETMGTDALEFTSRLIEKKLLEFNVQVKVLAAYPGPVVTRYEIEPAVGVKGSQIVNLVKDLARSLSVASIRLVETIPGKSCMGLEIPNPKRQVVRLSEILSSKVYADMSSPITLALGKDISGYPVVADLARMPHLLVAGTTGSGKSVAINAMILSLLYKATPKQIRVILIDPKMLELSVYEGIPHLLAPVVTDMRQAGAALNWCIAEMERRYKVMSALGVRNLTGYNSKVADAEKAGNPLKNPFSLTPDMPESLEPLPLIVVVIDELADLMMVVGKKVEELIARLAQKARASGINLILATQRPSVDVITGLIKANIPTRIAFQVSSKIDSRTILDQMGAEALLGQGDMLYLPPGSGYPQRVHGAFVADQEVHKVVEYLREQGEPNYVEGILDGPDSADESEDLLSSGSGGGEKDPLYDQAVEVVLKSRRASISLVQRHLRIGYNRAARLIEDMERAGMVSPMQSNGNREILAPGAER
ncbi:MAG: DNA translocase FtsK 4TM domain-containing protein [Pseudomonadota bacterium]|nr:DNA translocase FtsK 4TM domain-containing protein [Pseudomonadota bacterium]